MKTIYVDPISFACHTKQNAEGTRIPYDTDYFDGKCDAFVEGYIVIPYGYSLFYDGTVFRGEMITPLDDYSKLAAAQAQYEADLAAAAAAYQEGVNAAYDQ